MLKPKVFLSAYFDLFFKKSAKIYFNDCEIFIDIIGSAHKLTTPLLSLKNLWDEKALQTLKSCNFITLTDGFHLTNNKGEIFFEQIILDHFSYAKSRKNILKFYQEFLDYQQIFS